MTTKIFSKDAPLELLKRSRYGKPGLETLLWLLFGLVIVQIAVAMISNSENALHAARATAAITFAVELLSILALAFLWTKRRFMTYTEKREAVRRSKEWDDADWDD